MISYDRTPCGSTRCCPRRPRSIGTATATANTNDEWIEVYNRGSAAIDLGGWLLDDIAAGGSAPYVIPAGVLLQPGGFLVLFRDRTGVTLNNDGDTVRLLGPDAAEVDTFTYAKAKSDRSFSRSTDGDGPWTETYPPSPGQCQHRADTDPYAHGHPDEHAVPGRRDPERDPARPAARGLGPEWRRRLRGRVDRALQRQSRPGSAGRLGHPGRHQGLHPPARPHDLAAELPAAVSAARPACRSATGATA